MTTTITRYRSYDAVVVGARVAGAATSMLLAQRGLRVLAVERARAGSDTLSTLALMRSGVLQLSRWGLLPRLVSAGTPAVRRTTFHYGDECLPIEIKPRDGVDALYAPRRTVLDPLLVEGALDSGAEVHHGIRLVDVTTAPGGRVNGVVLEDPRRGRSHVHAGIVIGADGRDSLVARLVGAETLRSGEHAAGNVFGFWSGLEPDGYHWYYRPGVSAGVIPTNDGATIVFASMPGERFGKDIRFALAEGHRQVLREASPELAESLAGAKRLGSLHGFGGMPGFLRRSRGPGWALVGDAGYFKDPITAHGITDALRDAELLARAVAAGTESALAGYEAQRDALSKGLFEVTDQIASFQWHLSAVKHLHLTLSKEMNRDVDALLALDGSDVVRQTA
jgi:flavin-dependent dehydrogenase